jgi:hypothetical protein
MWRRQPPKAATPVDSNPSRQQHLRVQPTSCRAHRPRYETPNQPLIGQSPQAARLTGGLHYKALTELLSGTGNELGIKCFERRLNLLNVRNEIRRHVPGHR